jgi:hypothetical protein
VEYCFLDDKFIFGVLIIVEAPLEEEFVEDLAVEELVKLNGDDSNCCPSLPLPLLRCRCCCFFRLLFVFFFDEEKQLRLPNRPIIHYYAVVFF